tara:strand:- start:2875 stop:3435 length:561 start_codon:yes stop_codon:yes gene_type:complete
MACDLTLGRKEPCKDSVGGIKEVYFVNFGDLGAITYDSTDTDVIDAIAGTPSAYKYEVRGNSSFTQNIQSSEETGTTAFEQVVELTLKRLTKEDHKEIKLLAFGRPHMMVVDHNNNAFLAGLDNGMQVTGGTIVTGAAMSELSGYTLTLSGMERLPANFLAKVTEEPPSLGAVDIAAVGFSIEEAS